MEILNWYRSIFDLKKMNAANFNYDDAVLIGMSIGYVINQIDIENKEFNKVILNENFQDLVITIYVDYGSLRAYYAEINKNNSLKNSSRKNILSIL